MADFDLKELRYKTSEQLTPSEKDYLNTHQEELNDEDKAAYANFLTQEEVEQKEIDNKPQEGAEEVIAEKPQEEEEKELGYIKKEELDDFLEAKRKEWDLASVSKTEQKDKETEIKKLFDKDPGDWEEVANKISEYAIEKYEAKKDAQDKALSTIQTTFISQYNQLVKEQKAPALNTKEGQDFFAKLDQVGGEYGKNNMQDAYGVWSKLPEEFGGGYKPMDKKKALDAQKKRASQVGSGVGSESQAKPTGKKYSELHGFVQASDLLKSYS